MTRYGSIRRTGTRRRDQYAKAYRKSVYRGGMNFSIRVHVERSLSGRAPGALFWAHACPATRTPTRINATSRESKRCGGGHGGTPTAAAKKALRAMAAKLR